MSSGLPRVSVVVLNDGGRHNLDACRASLQAQDYAADRFRIEVVNTVSVGRAVACNAAVGRSDADFVALLAHDVRVDPQWLAEMVRVAQRYQAAVVAAKIVDPTSEAIDFAGGGISFTGHRVGAGIPPPSATAKTGDQVLFACVGAGLFSRAAFLDAGGFDEAFIGSGRGSLEDVDFGWRMNTFGHAVIFAAEAVAYRPSDSSLPHWDRIRQLRLQERNALAMIYKNYESATVARVLPVAVALSLLRGLTRSGIDTLTLDLSSEATATVDVASELIAHLIALEDFHRQLPALRSKRALVQKRRRRTDAQVLPLLGAPLDLHDIGGSYASIAQALIADLGVDELCGTRPASPVPAGAGSLSSETGRRPAAPEVLSSQPLVSIIIPTALGATHVCECLDSLRQQTYPADRIEVIVVDNNSADDPTTAVQRSYPGALVIRNASNIGFAAANNVGAAAASGEYLIFLNDDTRVHADWLSEMVDTARRRGAASVASFIVDWSGTEVDFVDGAVNFQGKGFQLHYGARVDSLRLEEKPMLFACGCAMLVHRAVFVAAGRWDEGTFAYYEDVELGWRLNLLGHSVWFSPRSVVHHKHHGTSGQWPEPPRTRLYERNSLRIIYELLERTSLQRALTASLLLAADRALLSTPLSRATEVPAGARRLTPARLKAAVKKALVARGITPVAKAVLRLGIRGWLEVAREVMAPTPPRRTAYLVEFGDVPPGSSGVQSESLSIEAAAILSGIYGFLSDIPALTRRRQDVQRRRCVSDEEIVSQFGSHWLQPVPARFPHEHHVLQRLLLVEGLAVNSFGNSDRD
jgi:GT2 family glycosyltransferase